MNIAEAIRVALQSLWANKLRSVLTLLGVVIGVGAVIAVVTFVSGIQDYVAKKIFNLGADVFIIVEDVAGRDQCRPVSGSRETQELRHGGLPGRARSLPPLRIRGRAWRNSSGHVKHNEQSISDTTIQGITPSMATILDTDLTYGPHAQRDRPEQSLAGRRRRAPTSSNTLLGGDPLGQEIRVDGWTYQVIGVGKKKGKTLGQSARQLRDDSDHRVSEAIRIAQQQHQDLGQSRRPPEPR